MTRLHSAPFKTSIFSISWREKVNAGTEIANRLRNVCTKTFDWMWHYLVFANADFQLDLLQVDLLASGASLFWPRSGRPRATKSREVDLSRVKGLHLPFPPKMGRRDSHLGFQVSFASPWLQWHRPVFGSVKLAPIKYEKAFVPRHMKSDEGLFESLIFNVRIKLWSNISQGQANSRKFQRVFFKVFDD